MPEANRKRGTPAAVSRVTPAAAKAVSSAEQADVARFPHSAEPDYRILFESAPDAVLVVDLDTTMILDANPAACALFACSWSEAVTHSVVDFSLEPEQTRATLSNAISFVPSRRLRRMDGTEFVAEITTSRARMDGTRAHIAFIRDISLRAAAAKARDESERKFAAAFAASPDAVNISRISDGLVVEVNRGFTALTGFTPEDVVGKSAVDLGLWADPGQRERAVEMLRATGRLDNLEADFVRKDGTTFPGLASACLVELDGVAHVISVTKDVSALMEATEGLMETNDRLSHIVREVIVALGRVVEIRDPYTHGHQERVARVSRAIATEMGLAQDDAAAVEMSALVHDVGKLSVPAEILNKPGALSEVEFGLIKTHSDRGYEILKGVEFPWPMAQIVLQHHERQDGSGYPQGLSGDEILMGARILAVADVVEAMASYRPYRPALGLSAAVAEIEAHPEKFDSDACAACMALYARGDLAFLNA